MNKFVLSTAFSALLLIGSAAQAMTLSKEITLADGRGGEMVAMTSGEMSAAGAARSTDASFTNFQPKADGGSVSGSLNREYRRDGRDTESLLNGALVVTPGANATNPQVLNIDIVDLRVVREGEGPQLSGNVSVNGQSVPAERLPQALRSLLRRLVALTQL